MANMTPEKMKEAGRATWKMSWTDQELRDQIKALELTIAYLDGRKDCRILLLPLYLELEKFRGFKEARGLK